MSATINRDPWLDLDLAELGDDLFTPSKNGWLQLCRAKVNEGKADWLEKFAFDDISKLTLPNGFLDGTYAEEKRKKNAVLFVANCALAALTLKTGDSANTPTIVDCFRRAILTWHKSVDLDFSTPITVPTLTSNSLGLGQIAKAFSDQNPLLEIVPTVDLTTVFVGQHDSWQKSKTFWAKFPVVDRRNSDHILICQFEVQRRSKGTGVFYRDPTTMAFSVVDPEFDKSVKDSEVYMRAISGNWARFDYRWRVREARKFNRGSIFDKPLERGSVGLAASLALEDATSNRRLAKDYVFTGTIEAVGSIGSVGHLREKIRGTTDTHTIFVPKANESEELREAGSHPRRIVFSNSFYHAREKLREFRRNRNLIWGAGLASAILLLGLLSGFGLYQASQAEMARKETSVADDRARASDERAEAEKLEKLASNARAAAEGLRADAAKQDELNALKERDLADRERNLATQQSRILQAKNVELGIARDEEAKQRRVANKNETKARAYEQIAQASRLAANGYKQLAEGDRTSAQALFSKALTLDDQDGYRAALAEASFNFGNPNFKLSWSKQLAVDFEENCCSSSALSPEGEFLAISSDSDHNVKVFHAASGQEISTLPVKSTVDDIALSRKGEFLAIKTETGVVTLLEVENGRTYYEFETKRALISQYKNIFSPRRVLFSEDGKYLAVISGSREITTVNMPNRKVTRLNYETEFPDAEISSLAFGPKNIIAFAFNHGPIFAVSVENHTAAKQVHSWASYRDLGFTKSGDLVSTNGDIEVFDRVSELAWYRIPESQRLRQRVRPDYQIASSPSLPYFATVGDSGVVHFWDGIERINQISFGMGKPVRILLGSNGRLVLQNSKGMIFSWDVIRPTYKSFDDFEDVAEELGDRTYLDCEKNKISVKTIKTEDVVFAIDSSDCEEVFRLSENEKLLFLSRDKKSVEVYEVDTGKSIAQHDRLETLNLGEIRTIAPDNFGNQIAIAGTNSIAIIPANGTQPYKVDYPKSISNIFAIGSIVFSPKDTFLVLQTENSVNLIEVASGRLVHSIPFSPRKCPVSVEICSWMSISQNEEYVGLVTLVGGLVEIWKLTPYRHVANVIKTGTEMPEIAVGAGFTTDSRFFVWSSGGSGRLHFYDLAKEKQSDFPAGEGIESFAVAPTGEFVINGSENYYVLPKNLISSFFEETPGQIYNTVSDQSGRKVNTTYKSSFSQTELDTLINTSRLETPELTASDQWGNEHKPTKDFGGVEVLRAKRGRTGTTHCQISFSPPSFNAYPIPFIDKYTPPCSDFPLIDIRKDQSKPWAATAAEFFSIRDYKAGDVITAQLYINNGSADSRNPESTAKNVSIETKLTSNGNLHHVTAYVSASNAAPLFHTITVRTNLDEYLEIIPNSGGMFDYRGRAILDQQKLNLGNSIFFLGDLDADWQYSVFLTYKMSVRKR